MKSTITSKNGFDILELNGEVDLLQAPELREEILNILDNGLPLLVDMSEVSYMDSSGIAGLVEGFQKARGSGLKFGLLSVRPEVMQVLTLTRLDTIFALFDSEDEFREQLES